MAFVYVCHQRESSIVATWVMVVTSPTNCCSCHTWISHSNARVRDRFCSLRIQPPLIRSRYYVRNVSLRVSRVVAGANESGCIRRLQILWWVSLSGLRSTPRLSYFPLNLSGISSAQVSIHGYCVHKRGSFLCPPR